jgi:DHA1 family bicyclomycin/chloramphenicol resistance-like MFS transporter
MARGAARQTGRLMAADSASDHARHWGLAALLGGLAMVSPFSIDTFFPSFPAIATEFRLTDWQIQQTITVYMLPYAITALIHGPLSDALGRRPVVIGGITLYTLASVACAFAPTFGMLLVFRAVQGMTAGTGMVVGRAVVRDLHEGPQAQRLMAAITMIFSIAPAVAPVIGGWIHVALGWGSVFGFMVLLGLVLVTASAWRLPETHPSPRRVPFSSARLVDITGRILSDRRFLLLALAGGANFSAMLLFIGSAPTIVLHHWHLSETEFANLFVPLIVGFVIGAGLSGRLAHRVEPARQLSGGALAVLAGTALMVALQFSMSEPPLIAQQLALAILASGIQLAFPVLTLRMLDMFPLNRGSAASVQSFVSLVMSSAVIGLLAPALKDSFPALASGSLVLALSSVLFWRLAPRKA